MLTKYFPRICRASIVNVPRSTMEATQKQGTHDVGYASFSLNIEYLWISIWVVLCMCKWCMYEDIYYILIVNIIDFRRCSRYLCSSTCINILNAAALFFLFNNNRLSEKKSLILVWVFISICILCMSRLNSLIISKTIQRDQERQRWKYLKYMGFHSTIIFVKCKPKNSITILHLIMISFDHVHCSM